MIFRFTARKSGESLARLPQLATDVGATGLGRLAASDCSFAAHQLALFFFLLDLMETGTALSGPKMPER